MCGSHLDSTILERWGPAQFWLVINLPCGLGVSDPCAFVKREGGLDDLWVSSRPESPKDNTGSREQAVWTDCRWSPAGGRRVTELLVVVSGPYEPITQQRKCCKLESWHGLSLREGIAFVWE